MGHRGARVAALLAALLVIAPILAQEDAVLKKVKADLRSCRSSLNDVEEEKDRCLEIKNQLRMENRELESKLSGLSDSDDVLNVAQEEANLVRKELEIAQDRLAACDTAVKSAHSREQTAKQDLSLAQAELAAAAARETAAEKALRQNDCGAARRDLRTYRETAEQFAIENQVLKDHLATAEAAAATVPQLEARAAEVDRARKEAEEERAKLKAALAAVTAELEVTKKMAAQELAVTKQSASKELEATRQTAATELSAAKNAAAAELSAVKKAAAAELEAARTVGRAEREATERALRAELAAAKKALDSLLESLDARQKYEALLEAHRGEWLPHWLSERAAAATNAARAAVNAAAAAAAPPVAAARASVSKFYELRVSPALARLDAALAAIPGWSDVRDGTAAAASRAHLATQKAIKNTVKRAQAAERAAEDAILQRMRGVEALAPVARREVVHYALWGLTASILVPIGIAIVKAIVSALIHALRPGTAAVASPPSAAVAKDLLRYRFSDPGALEAVFEDRLRPRLAFLGAAVAQAVAAERAVAAAPADAPAAALAAAAARDAGPNALADAAQAAGVARFITPGPGARSAATAKATAASVFAAVLGAIYMDSKGDMKAVKALLDAQDASNEEIKAPVAPAPAAVAAANGGEDEDSDDDSSHSEAN